MKPFIKKPAPKPVVLSNPVNNEIWYCNDFNNVKLIDGEEFLTVHKIENPHRTFLMKKNVLKLLDKRNYPIL